MNETIYDLAIIGGGPAGVSAGVYASRKRLRTVFITKDFQGQSSVSDGIENWIGTVKISGTDLAKSLENHLRAYAGDVVDIVTGVTAEKVAKGEVDQKTGKNLFLVTTSKGMTYRARTVLSVAGSHRRRLDVKGGDIYEHKGLTYCATCDGPIFADQDVVVVGGGNAGFESASQLLAYCKSVTLLNRSEVFKADPVTVEKLSKNEKMKIITNAVPKEVLGKDGFVSGLIYTDTKTGKDVELSVTGIFVEIGSVPTTYFMKEVAYLDPYNRIPVDPRNQRAVDSDGKHIEGIWSAGDCTDGLYHQNNIASGDAVKALEDIYFYLHTV